MVDGELNVAGGSIALHEGQLTVQEDVSISNSGKLRTECTDVEFKSKLNVRSGVFGADGGALSVAGDVNIEQRVSMTI